MAKSEKIKVAVIFGGRSGEHEVSLVSASSVIEAMDESKYQVVEIGITEEGKWLMGDNCLAKFKRKDYADLDDALTYLCEKSKVSPGTKLTENGKDGVDIAFPVLHGPYGEDGRIQGLFEMLDIPYVGCEVLASSTAMDKLQCKAIWEAAGLPVVPYIGFTRDDWKKVQEKILAHIAERIEFPCFVKPVNMGSSVGISKVKSADDLAEAVNLAAKFDRRIMVEKGINAREIECAVLGNEKLMAAPLGEIIVGGEFYDFNDKYIDGVSKAEIPAKLEKELAEKIQKIAIEAYRSLDCCGLARVDSFVDRDSGKVYLNEINTMPGFTSISMYPKMMEAVGVSYPELVDRLVELGLERHKENSKNQMTFESGSDWYKA